MNKYFSEKEFTCSGKNCYHKMNTQLIEMLNVARELAGVPFIITSSYRDAETNAKAGGKPNSAHLRGNAVDISCTSSCNRMVIIDALIIAGFNRIGIAKTFIHCDIDELLPQDVMWLY